VCFFFFVKSGIDARLIKREREREKEREKRTEEVLLGWDFWGD